MGGYNRSSGSDDRGKGTGKGSGIAKGPNRDSDDRGKGNGYGHGQGGKDSHNRKKTRNGLIGGRHRDNGRQLWERPRRPEMTPWQKGDKDDSDDYDDSVAYYNLEDLGLYPIFCFDVDGKQIFDPQ